MGRASEDGVLGHEQAGSARQRHGTKSSDAHASSPVSCEPTRLETRTWPCRPAGSGPPAVVARVLAELDRFDGVVARRARTQLEIPGCGAVSAAVLLGETAGVHRFRSKDAYARFTGTAPVPVWSGASAGKVRLNRGGNRQANWALQMIAVTQARGVGPGKNYLQRQTDRGKDRAAAFLLLRRRLSDTVFTALRADQLPRQDYDPRRLPAAGVPVAA